jgi:hypothetical protein
MCHERWVQLGDESVERGWLRRLFDREHEEPTPPPPEARPDEPVTAPDEQPERKPPVLV